ncbi:MAG: flagellar hook protein FlgE, partial [Syntrophomonadaceae bacterium]|nr:flagellar hook protein FlgE [Syntrophomonadaceae bacterium]
MMRSLYAGVTGLRNHQTRLDVIGSNIANVNTVGYKKSRVTFRDALYQNLRGSSSPQGNRGGTNPMQVGLGINLSTIDVIHTGGSPQNTGKTTDLCIQGEGYFVCSDGSSNYFTRAGIFDFDEAGNLINVANGFKVMGYRADSDGVLDVENLVPISIADYRSVPPQATSEVRLTGNLDAGLPLYDPLNHDTFSGLRVLTKTVYDSLGYEHTLQLSLEHTAAGEWEISWDFDNGAETGGPTAITFDPLGNVDAGGGSPTDITITTTSVSTGANQMDFTVDFSDITQYDSETTIWPEYQNGYKQGDLKGFTVDVTGTITGSYSNGQTKNIAQVATAIFQNPAGLLQIGENLFQFSNNSGDSQIGQPGVGGRGTIIPGSLEM